MKRNSIATSSLVVLSLLLTATGAYAQSAGQANVPFAFKVGTAQVPAGTYSMKKEFDTNIVSIRNVKTNAIVLAVGTGQSPSKTTGKLIFRHVGSQYILTEIWVTAGTPGMAFPAPQRNSELQAASRAIEHRQDCRDRSQVIGVIRITTLLFPKPRGRLLINSTRCR